MGTSCSAIPGDMKVRAQRDGRSRYYLPDIVVTCDSKMVGDVEITPCLIVELLSACRACRATCWWTASGAA